MQLVSVLVFLPSSHYSFLTVTNLDCYSKVAGCVSLSLLCEWVTDRQTYRQTDWLTEKQTQFIIYREAVHYRIQKFGIRFRYLSIADFFFYLRKKPKNKQKQKQKKPPPKTQTTGPFITDFFLF